MVKVPQVSLQQLKAYVKVDVSPKSPYDRFAVEQTLENFLMNGLLHSSRSGELKAYAKALPDGSTSPKQALLDIAKVCFVIWLAELIFPNFEQAFVVAGVCCILGHIFPFYMKFRGGKGLACLGGMILMYDWRIFLIMLLSEIVVLVLTQYLCFVPITAAVAFVVIYGVINKDILGILLLAVAALVITFKHGKNIARIRMGTEARFFGYLFNKEKEIARLKQNAENE
jgi:glycerol-3-phosphate acyltransferase PlsY